MKKRLLFMMIAAGALLLPVATAWACTNLASLNLSEANVSAGDTIDVTGTSFSSLAQASPGEGGEAAEPVQLRWNSADGTVLGEFETDARGTFQGSIRVPADAAPGSYVLVATQNVIADAEEGDIRAAYGTPARAAIHVDAPPVAVRDVSVPAMAAAAGSPGADAGLLSLGAFAAMGLLALGLLAAGAGLFIRDVRSGREMTPERVRSK